MKKSLLLAALLAMAVAACSKTETPAPVAPAAEAVKDAAKDAGAAVVDAAKDAAKDAGAAVDAAKDAVKK